MAYAYIDFGGSLAAPDRSHIVVTTGGSPKARVKPRVFLNRAAAEAYAKDMAGKTGSVANSLDIPDEVRAMIGARAA
jgi:hypothetical protein